MKIKFPPTVMVFGVVSSEGHVMPPHIFETGLRGEHGHHSRGYGSRTRLQPKAKRTQEWLKSNAFVFVLFSSWPPSSPDLNTLDYFVWS
uniref:Uncharacterized protein n=1 Tax=Lepeophtheirus salmonis TaxID=72036 RepID=A0A0K2U7N8_LEPSM